MIGEDNGKMIDLPLNQLNNYIFVALFVTNSLILHR